MKQLVIQTFLATILIFAAHSLKAQQPKAFEIIKYTAKSHKLLFHLDYADGYIGASKIRLTNSLHTMVTFHPISGVPENDRKLYFYTKAADKKDQIILTGINEDKTAPAIIRATYRKAGQNIALIFYRAKSRLK